MKLRLALISAVIAPVVVALTGCSPAVTPAVNPGETSPAATTSGTSADATFYIVRHGKTLFNLKGITSGWSDSPLTDKGEDQARQAGASLASVPFTAAVSSDLGRARTTAEVILESQKSTAKLKTSPLLREEYYGGFEGDTDASWYGDLMESFGYKLDKDWTNYEAFLKGTTFQQRTDATAERDKMKLAETWDQYETRAKKAVEMLKQEAATANGGNILVVSHGTTISLLLELMDPDTYSGQDIANASAAIVSLHDGTFTIEKLPEG